MVLYDCANDAKANFDDIYNAPDPRAYYTTLSRFDYQIPTNAKPIFQKIIDCMDKNKRPMIVDVGCSYGVNAAMVRFGLTFQALACRYASDDMQHKSIAETVIDDAKTFARLEEETPADFVGLDVADEAAGYADAVGLIEGAVVENLESAPMSPESAERIGGADLIITTGAVGYVGERTFSEIAKASEEPPWVAAFVLRQFPFEPIADKLAEFDLATERLPDATFVQRRFVNEEEQEGAIEAVRDAGRDPEGLETEGCYHAEFYLVRPRTRIHAPIIDLGLI